ncbi:SMI1/KNR4 family protein [Pectobacterium versatile]|uniref:SMI1/KNR4 family protein n=1 Tax=Pectobacterium versatile TaxID=2488639 RepID=UPI001CCC2804|nr:SMI1/KNR4 family protein [Pectobacterium versatile]
MHKLNDLESWLINQLPEVAEDLNPGATHDELDAFIQHIGVAVPEDFLTLYRWHNGQRMAQKTGLWYGLSFLPLARVMQEVDGWREVVNTSSDDDLASLNDAMSSTPPSYVKRLYANPLWVPFAYDWGSNYLAIDLDPDTQGTRGQVINCGRDEERKIAIAPSLDAFVHWMMEELHAGNVNIRVEDDGGRSFNTLRPEKYHFLDSLAAIFNDTPPPADTSTTSGKSIWSWLWKRQ